MISTVKDIIVDRVSGVTKDELSVVLVRTAQPKSLVFRHGVSIPIYVVQFGPKEALLHIHDSLGRLSKVMGKQVPDSLVCEAFEENTWIQIQTGLPGTPWFSLRKDIQTINDWKHFRDRSISTLFSFHDAVCSVPEWNRQISIAEELGNVYENLCKKGFVANSAVKKHVLESISSLVPLGEIECFYQHGDFCVNNLLIDDESIGIVDYEHFGHTVMPFHDNFLLAESLVDYHPNKNSVNSAETTRACLNQVDLFESLDADQIEGFYLHHLLWWIAETESIDLRLERNKRYRECLMSFSNLSYKERQQFLGLVTSPAETSL